MRNPLEKNKAGGRTEGPTLGWSGKAPQQTVSSAEKELRVEDWEAVVVQASGRTTSAEPRREDHVWRAQGGVARCVWGLREEGICGG